MSILSLIVSFLLGHKYYACVLNMSGTNKCEISCFIFKSKREVENYRMQMYNNRSYRIVKVISFRSRQEFNK